MIGTLLGNRYELIEKIGEGGMANVYRAKCHLLNRFVSVKILKEEYSKDKDFVEKFKREAAAVASLSDNNIVNIYDVGTQGDINYIVMEYIEGKTLKEIIVENGRLENNKAIDIAIEIAKALDCAHRNNIVHRDIKPQNILVTEDGIVKVTDFGIAKAASAVTMTNTSKVMGSAHYFSPEQAKGSFVDFRSDIYSLGIVLYEMVVGKVPFDAESPVSVALKHIQEPAVPPKQINELIPESLNKLIIKAIEKEPIRRYQNIKDMLLDLQKVKANSSVKIITNNFDDDYTKIMEPVVVDDEHGRKIDDAHGRKKILNNKKKKILIFSLVAVLIIAIGSLAGWAYYNKINPIAIVSQSQTSVPTIIGKTQAVAKKLVVDQKLIFAIAGTQTSDQPEGTVISCSPSVGTAVEVNSAVTVYISSGAAQINVPSFVDLDLPTAKINIVNSGLTLGTVTEAYSDSVPSGYVISQTPENNANVTKNTKINLVVSEGQETSYIIVPNLNDETLVEATTTLNSIQLNLGSTKLVPNTIGANKNGMICNQAQAAYSHVQEGSAIDVSYYGNYTGPIANLPPVINTIPVPNLKDKTLDEAAAILNAKDLMLGSKTKVPNTVGANENWKISNQNQVAGSQVSVGTVISVSYYDNYTPK